MKTFLNFLLAAIISINLSSCIVTSPSNYDAVYYSPPVVYTPSSFYFNQYYLYVGLGFNQNYNYGWWNPYYQYHHYNFNSYNNYFWYNGYYGNPYWYGHPYYHCHNHFNNYYHGPRKFKTTTKHLPGVRPVVEPIKQRPPNIVDKPVIKHKPSSPVHVKPISNYTPTPRPQVLPRPEPRPHVTPHSTPRPNGAPTPRGTSRPMKHSNPR